MIILLYFKYKALIYSILLLEIWILFEDFWTIIRIVLHFSGLRVSEKAKNGYIFTELL